MFDVSVYAPLQERLVRASQPIVTLSFEEIEQVLGRRLPPSARDERVKRQWWANTDTHVQARAWLKAGRRARLDVAQNAVAFVQESRETDEQKITLDSDVLSGAGLGAIRIKAQEEGVGFGVAASLLLNELGIARRKAVLDWWAENAQPGQSSSVDLIREDRDAR